MTVSRTKDVGRGDDATDAFIYANELRTAICVTIG
jgi:hypothetical protein